jgi:hypothetical protein
MSRGTRNATELYAALWDGVRADASDDEIAALLDSLADALPSFRKARARASGGELESVPFDWDDGGRRLSIYVRPDLYEVITMEGLRLGKQRSIGITDPAGAGATMNDPNTAAEEDPLERARRGIDRLRGIRFN